MPHGYQCPLAYESNVQSDLSHMNALFPFKSPEDASRLIFPKTINVYIASLSEPHQLLFEGGTRSVEIEEAPPILQKREYLLVNVLHHLGIAHVVNRYGGHDGFEWPGNISAPARLAKITLDIGETSLVSGHTLVTQFDHLLGFVLA